MTTIIFDGKPITAEEFRGKCLSNFPGLQSSRKRTIYENIERMADGGHEKAAAFVSRVTIIDD